MERVTADLCHPQLVEAVAKGEGAVCAAAEGRKVTQRALLGRLNGGQSPSGRQTRAAPTLAPSTALSHPPQDVTT